MSKNWYLYIRVLLVFYITCLLSCVVLGQTSDDCGYAKGQGFAMCPDGQGCPSDVCSVTTDKLHFCTTKTVSCKCSNGQWVSPGVIDKSGTGIVEAETDNCGAWPPTPVVDEWFSYSARGELTDVYESTPHIAASITSGL